MDSIKHLKGKLKKVGNLARQNPMVMKFKRLRDNPFQDKEYIIIHCGHHKAGTVWFNRVLSTVAMELGIPYAKRTRVDIPPEFPGRPCIFQDTHSLVDFSRLQNYRGSHMIRDPRDLVVSGYCYHLWTKEDWANMPIKDWLKSLPILEERLSLLPLDKIKNMTYKDYLNSLSKEEGLLAEMKKASGGPIRTMVEWDYTNKNIFEFKYEEIMKDEEKVFRQIFQHYGFKERAVEKAVTIAGGFSFKKLAKRKVGEVDGKSHLRSGRLQQWREEFDEDHKAYFKELHGKDFIYLGYELDMNW